MEVLVALHQCLLLQASLEVHGEEIIHAEEVQVLLLEVKTTSMACKAEISYYLTTVARHLYREEVFKEQVITSQ